MKELVNTFFSKRRNRIIMVLSLYGAFLIWWSVNISFGDGPDEAMRFQIPLYIFKHNSLPTLFDKKLLNNNYGISYAAQPCLPYIIGALFMKVAAIFGTPDNKLYMAARITSILSGVGFLYFNIKIVETIFVDKWKKRFMLVLVGLWPLICFTFAYVNCDAMSLWGISIITFSCLKGSRNDWNLKSCLGLMIGSTIVILSYLNGYGFVLVGGLILLLSIIFDSSKSNKIRFFLKKGIFVYGLTFLLSSWFFIRNIYLYGSLFGSDINTKYSIELAKKGWSVPERAAHAKYMMSTISGFFGWIKGTIFGFFGSFYSWNKTWPTPIFWVLTFILFIVLLLALIKLVKGIRNAEKRDKMVLSCMLLATVITVGMSLIFALKNDYQPQGRYILPIIIVVCYLVTLGNDYLFKKILKLNSLKYPTVCIFILLLGVDVISILYYV